MALDLEHADAERLAGAPVWRPDTLPLLWLMVLIVLVASATVVSWTGCDFPLVPRTEMGAWRLRGGIEAAIGRRGEVYLHAPGEPYVGPSAATMPAAVRAVVARHPRAGVSLLIDKDADQRRVDALLSELRAAGVREVVLVTREPRRRTQ